MVDLAILVICLNVVCSSGLPLRSGLSHIILCRELEASVAQASRFRAILDLLLDILVILLTPQSTAGGNGQVEVVWCGCYHDPKRHLLESKGKVYISAAETPRPGKLELT